jgi:hypothetical protein
MRWWHAVDTSYLWKIKDALAITLTCLSLRGSCPCGCR